MKKAVIIYLSHSGTTQQLGYEMKKHLENKSIEVTILSIENYNDELLKDVDYLLLGCWTSGWFFFMQHPQLIWKRFATKLPSEVSVKIALFTTYKILTGSMFTNMRKALKGLNTKVEVEIKSRNGLLSEKNKMILNGFIGK